MEIGDEILVKAKVVDLDSNPAGAAIKVEVLGSVDADELNRLLYGHGDTEVKKNKLFFWIHWQDQPKAIIIVKKGLVNLNIAIEKRAGPQHRIFHPNTRISLVSSDIQFVKKPDERLEKIGPIGSSLVKRVLAIPGVYIISIADNYLSVILNIAAHWEETEPSIIGAFQEVLGRTKEEVDTSYIG